MSKKYFPFIAATVLTVFLQVSSGFSSTVKILDKEVTKPKSENEKDTLKPVNLNTAVVTANKTRVNRSNVPLTVSVIERQEIEASGHSSILPILSLNVPGLFVTQRGVTGFGVSEGAAGAINIRGVGQGNKVLMLLDGQPQWAGVFGHALPDLYLSSDAERVEVIRGPGSLLYGSNAMGGVVNIITRNHDKEGRITKAGMSYGSYNTQKYSINNGYSKKGFSSFVSFNRESTDGHRIRSGFEITNGFIKAGYDLGKNFTVSADVALSKINNQNPGRADDPMIDNIMDILRGSAALIVENRHRYGSGALHLFTNKGEHTINDGYKIGGSPRNYLFNSKDFNTGVMVYENIRLFKGNSFTVGFDYKKWGGNAWNSPINESSSYNQTTLVDKEVNETAGYIVLQQDFFSNLTLNGGLRVEYNSVFDVAFIPQIGVTLKASPVNVIKASISKGYRSPNIRELYMFLPRNPDLLPENMINFELSAGHTMLNSNLSAELSLFYIDGWNMIQTVVINGVPKNLNTGLFENKGIEFQASYRIRPDLRTDFNYSYLKTSKPIVAAPKHKVFASVGYTPGDFAFNFNVQHIGGLYLNTATRAQGSYTIFNARASYRLDLKFINTRFFISGDNITDTSYSINEGFPMPGITILSGFDIIF